MTDLQEKKQHGQASFPYAVYRTRLPEYIRSYPLHWHEEMEFIAVVEGQGTITVRAEHYPVHQGDILLIPPQMLHGIEQQDLEMEYFNILFRLTMLEGTGENGILRQLYDPAFPIPILVNHGSKLNTQLWSHMLELIQNRKRRDGAYSLMIRSHLLAILYHIIDNANIQTPKSLHIQYDNLKPVLQYIQQHYSQDITVRQAAAMCGFSESYFMKLFRELTGTSFLQYLKRLRLEKAEICLRSGLRVSETAEQTGFRNLSYFTRCFQGQFGLSPSAYRQRYRSSNS